MLKIVVFHPHPLVCRYHGDVVTGSSYTEIGRVSSLCEYDGGKENSWTQPTTMHFLEHHNITIGHHV